jgi:hypothetical protein
VLKSWYVFGSSKPATMSMTSAYAFGKKNDAEKFAKEFGGKVMSFYSVLDSVKSTLHKESVMIKERQTMVAEKGEMMYNKLCTPFDNTFSSIAEAKTFLTTQKPCGEIGEAQLQAIAIYLNLRN